MTTRAHARREPAPPYVPHCGCGARWTGLSPAHCGACHLTFSAITAFDQHRAGGACRAPDTVGLIDRDGVWGRPGEHPRAGQRDAE